VRERESPVAWTFAPERRGGQRHSTPFNSCKSDEKACPQRDRLNGRQMEPELKLQVGAAAHPYMRRWNSTLLCHKKKISVGADFLITQAVFSTWRGSGNGWMPSAPWTSTNARPLSERLAADQRGKGPGASAEPGLRTHRGRGHRPAPQFRGCREGRNAIAAEMAAKLKGIPGVRGINILSGGQGNED